MDETLRQFWAPFVGAVSLTFDDGCDSQLEKAIPWLEERGFRGTFFPSSRVLSAPEKSAPWQRAAAAGHEIGNHTWSHTCSANFTGSGGLEEWTLADIEQDILRQQELLVGLFPDQAAWTFAYPCYQTDVGRGLGRQSYVPVVARHFLAGRGWGQGPFGNHPRAIDLALVWGTPVERMSGMEMIGVVETEAALGKWTVLVFHEIQGHRLSVCGEDFKMLLDHLDRARDRIRTDTFGSVARRIADHQEKGRNRSA